MGNTAASGLSEGVRAEMGPAELKGRAVRGAAATLAGQVLRTLLHTVSTMVLARLLTPADFGLIAMVSTVVGIVGLFKDLGLPLATVQRASVTQDQISALFWINLGVSGLLTGMTAAMAPVVAWFFGEPRLTWITLALSGTFLFSGLASQHVALLRRSMRLTAVAMVDVVAMACGLVTAIAMGWMGFGYWSLVAMTGVSAVMNAVLGWALSGWRPTWPTHWRDLGSMLAFGANITAIGIVTYFARNMDNLLIGWWWGATALGLYVKSYGLLMLPLQQINWPIGNIALPMMSRLQNDPERYRRTYLRAIQFIAYTTLPLVAGLAVMADVIVTVVLGPKWTEAGRIFHVLAFAAIHQPIMSACTWVPLSLGRAGRVLKLTLVGVPLLIVSFAAGLPWGPLGVAIGYAICTNLIVVPTLMYAFHGSPVSFWDVMKVTLRPLGVAALLYGGIWTVRWLVGPMEALATLGISAATGAALVGALMAVSPVLRREMTGLLRLTRDLRSPRREKQSAE